MMSTGYLDDRRQYVGAHRHLGQRARCSGIRRGGLAPDLGSDPPGNKHRDAESARCRGSANVERFIREGDFQVESYTVQHAELAREATLALARIDKVRASTTATAFRMR